ncbi:MAG TPA: sulfite exporter TauE/SafE family protein [Terriglobales bacterium]|nr:sulfite exporter TauE/SafE family protein [Terriglobales bacterium]
MDVTLIFLAICFLAAILAGFLGGLFGIGGGIIIVPFLSVFMGIPIHDAIAISLVSVIATSNAGGSSYLEQKITNIKLAMYLEVATTAGALVGSIITLLLRSWVLFIIFGVLLVYVSFTSFKSRATDERRMITNEFAAAKQDGISKYLGLTGSYFDASKKKEVEYRVNGASKGALISSLAGVTSGLLGIGGGLIKVAAMNMFMNVPLKAAVGTSKFMIGVTAAVGSLLFFVTGVIDVYILAPIALGTTLGATVSTMIMNRLRSYVLKVGFGILVAYLAYTMFVQGLLLGFGIKLPILG